MKKRIFLSISFLVSFGHLYAKQIYSQNCDPSFKAKAKAEFDRVKKKANIIMVTHSMKELKKTVDIAITLEKGKINIFENIDDAILSYKK